MIVAAGLTPAWQQTLCFDRLRIGEVNRAQVAGWVASGKVANVGIAAAHLGGPSLAILPAGGPTGRLLEEDLRRLGTPARILESATPTRVCTTLLDQSTGRSTELVENAGPIPEGECAVYLSAFEEAARSATQIVLTGSLPPGAPVDFYRQLMRRSPPAAQILLDARGPELLAALEGRPFLVKPNREELGKTFGRTLEHDADVWSAMQDLHAMGAEWVVVSEGGRAVRALSQEGRFEFSPPALPVVNPIGCGDCMAAGIAWALRQQRPPLDAIRFGIAAAADNLGFLLPARLDVARILPIERRVSWRKL